MLTRSHGLGNDYLVADPAELPFSVSPGRVRLLCDRHFGVGSDGLLLLNGELGLRIINPDGSEAEKSGNGLRIFARWLFDTNRVASRSFSVHLAVGDAAVEVHQDGQVTVDMGQPVFSEDLSHLELDGLHLDVTALSIGNPHCVVFQDKLDPQMLHRLGPRVEGHSAFPNRTNVQLAHVLDARTVELLIWERGAGETQASGSSACAVVAAAHRRRMVGADVTAVMPGGSLSVRIAPDGTLFQRGPVEEIARITLSPDLVRRLQAVP
jgi:diaminopimelate epimerase